MQSNPRFYGADEKPFNNQAARNQVPVLCPIRQFPVVILGGLSTSDAGIDSDIGTGLFFSTILAVPASAICLLLVGLPLFIALRRHNAPLLLLACTVGAVVPYMLFQGAPYPMALVAVAAGVAVALTAYWLRPVAPH